MWGSAWAGAVNVPQPWEEMPSDQLVGEITAWRAWVLGDNQTTHCGSVTDDGGLYAVSQNYKWSAGTNEAQCHQSSAWSASGRHPVELCVGPKYVTGQCGFWAMKSRREIPESYHPFKQAVRLKYAIGRVALWGRLVEGEHGFRAEFARVTALVFPSGTPLQQQARTFRAAEKYGVGVIFDEHRKAVAGD